MPRTGLTMGRGAVVSALARMIRPKNVIKTKFPNRNNQLRLSNMIVLGKAVRNNKEVIMLQSDELMDGDNHLDIWAAETLLTVVHKGRPEHFFVHGNTPEQPGPDGDEEEFPPNVYNVITAGRVTTDEDAMALMGNVEVDDDNEPAPENIPQPNLADTGCHLNDWGHDGICQRKLVTGVDIKPTISLGTNIQPSMVDLFELLFPIDFLHQVVLPHVNSNRKTARVVDYGEFLWFLGLCFLMRQWKIESLLRRKKY
jgi:hypothetical protein